MILVTGATGTVGSEVVRQLCGGGTPTRALVRSPEKADAMRGYDCEVAVGTFQDPAALDAAVDGVDAMFLCSPAGAEQVALETAAVDAAARAGVRVVKLAAMGWEHDTFGRLGRAHAEVVAHLRAAEVPYTVLAPNDFQQNLFRQAAVVQSTGTLPMPRGEAAVSSVDARDVAAVAAHVLTTPGHDGASYTITGPEALTGEQVAEALAGAIGRPVRYAAVPAEEARAEMLAAGADEWVAAGLIEVSEAYRAGAAALVTDEVTRATGRPATALRQFLADYRNAFA